MLARLWTDLDRLPRRFRVLVLGPHGRSYNFRSYGTVLMIATDVGIAGILPYIQSLVEASRRRQAMVRRVEVIWQVEDYRKSRPAS
jgi:NAD(P)H-flavin reductase